MINKDDYKLSSDGKTPIKMKNSFQEGASLSSILSSIDIENYEIGRASCRERV